MLGRRFLTTAQTAASGITTPPIPTPSEEPLTESSTTIRSPLINDASAVTVARTQPCLILVATDAALIGVLQATFASEKFQVIAVSDAQSLQDTLHTQAPSLIMVDVDAGPESLALLKLVRSRPLTELTPVFALIDPNQAELITTALAQGASDVFTKPLQPITLKHRVDRAMREHQLFQRFRQDSARRRHVDSAHPDYTALVDRRGRITDLLTAGSLTAVPQPKATVGLSLEECFPDGAGIALGNLCADAIRGMDTQHLEIHVPVANQPCIVDCSISPAGPGRALLVMREIPSRQPKLKPGRALNALSFDTKTGLLSREAFEQRMAERMPKPGAEHSLAIFRIQVNHFQEIANLISPAAADALLRRLGERLLMLTERRRRTSTTVLDSLIAVGRLDTNALGIITASVSDESEFLDLAGRLKLLLEEPVVHEGRELRSTFNVGISLAPRDGHDVNVLLRAAAMAASTAGADISAQVYSKTMQMQSLRKLDLETHLRRALENQELTLAYQPKMDLKTHQIVGFEALLRWQSAQFGWVSPLEIIPLAEQTGLIVPIGEWVMQKACADLAHWQAQGFSQLSVAVNVSAEQFHASDLTALAARILQNSQIRPEHLEIELTESCLMRDDQKALNVFNALRELGCRLSIDDFGTGYSSLQYLRKLPVHSLKIDRSFVKDIPADGGALAICRSVITLGRSLGLEVVAEGVETLEQADTLARRGATQAQGYLLAKPMKATQVIDWLDTGAWRQTLGEINSAGVTRQLQYLFRDPFTEEAYNPVGFYESQAASSRSGLPVHAGHHHAINGDNAA